MAPKLIVEQKKKFTPQNLTPLWAVQKKIFPSETKNFEKFS